MNHLKISEDGSHTVYSERFNSTYHSIHGSIQETQTVFIDAGLKYCANLEEVKVFEMGFGTGLNMLMTLKHFEDYPTQSISYEAIEAFPLNIEVYSKINYASQLEMPKGYDILFTCHKLPGGLKKRLSIVNDYSFDFEKVLGDIHKTSLKQNYFDLIYYDAFGPLVQPELWEAPILDKLFRSLKVNGVLVTYCAKGSFKRNLKSVGFEVEALPGPIGKREMTRAVKL